MTKRVYWPAIFTIICCFIIYLALSFSSWNEPLMGDHINLALAMKAVGGPGITQYFLDNGIKSFGIWHPPSYVRLIAFIGKFTGVNRFTARAVGILTFLISLILIYLISCELFKGSEKKKYIGMLACVIYSLNPLAIRGTMLLDMDGTILNAAILMFIYVLAKCLSGNTTFKNIFTCSVFCALMLWVKFSTPFVLLASIIIYQILGKNNNNLFQILKITFIGSFLFCATWLIYCHFNGRSFFDLFIIPMSIVKAIYTGSGQARSLAAIGRNIWAPIIWCSPSFALLALISLIKAFKEKGSNGSFMDVKQFAFYGAAVSVVYVFIGGVTHSFPKYHYAMAPVFSILIGYLMVNEIDFDKKMFMKMAIIGAVLVMYNFYIVRDPLYIVNYAMKKTVIMGDSAFVRVLAIKEIIAILLILLTIPIAYVYFKASKVPKSAIMSLLITMLAFNISLSLTQSKADYNTVYTYGARGVMEAADIVRSKTNADDIIFAPNEILWLTNENLDSYSLGWALWSMDRDSFLEMAEKSGPKCIVYGITGNTVRQYKEIFNTEPVQKFLRNKFERQDAGSYTIWVKK